MERRQESVDKKMMDAKMMDVSAPVIDRIVWAVWFTGLGLALSLALYVFGNGLQSVLIALVAVATFVVAVTVLLVGVHIWCDLHSEESLLRHIWVRKPSTIHSVSDRQKRAESN